MGPKCNPMYLTSDTLYLSSQEHLQENRYPVTLFKTHHIVELSRALISKEDLGWHQVISGEGNGNPLQCSGLENTTDRGTWRATVHGVAKSQT